MRLINLFKAFCVALVLALAPGVFAVEQPVQQTPPVAMVNINTADAATLAEALDGVGMTRALEIVAYRETYGKFRTIEELAEVKGIGMATVERNRHRIMIDDN